MADCISIVEMVFQIQDVYYLRIVLCSSLSVNQHDLLLVMDIERGMLWSWFSTELTIFTRHQILCAFQRKHNNQRIAAPWSKYADLSRSLASNVSYMLLTSVTYLFLDRLSSEVRGSDKLNRFVASLIFSFEESKALSGESFLGFTKERR